MERRKCKWRASVAQGYTVGADVRLRLWYVFTQRAYSPAPREMRLAKAGQTAGVQAISRLTWDPAEADCNRRRDTVFYTRRIG